MGLGALYVAHARSYRSPVVRLSHITAGRWRYIHIVGVLAVSGGTGASVFLPLYLKAGRGSSVAFAAFAVIWPTLGWSVAAWVSGQLQQHLRAQTVTLIGSGFMAVGAVWATMAAWTEAPIPVLLAAFTCSGWGIGTISTSSLALLQGRADLQEMGRVSSAHHFIRSLGFAYGAAVAGLVMFWVVDRRTGDAELVRGLLSDAEPVVDSAVAGAVGAAYTWSLAVMAVLSVLTVPAALALAKGRDHRS